MDELHRLSGILIERETIDKDQFERLLAGEDEDDGLPGGAAAEPAASRPPRSRSASPQPKPQPFPLPGRGDAAAAARALRLVASVPGLGAPVGL